MNLAYVVCMSTKKVAILIELHPTAKKYTLI